MYSSKEFGIIKKLFNISPPTMIFGSFVILILIGAMLLNLTISSRDGNSVGFINSLFTATSAFCVTGLVVKVTALQFTLFGQLVILTLIQIGGLGTITLFMYLLSIFGRKITLKERIAIQNQLNQDTPQGMVKLVKSAVKGTMLIELIGAVFLSMQFIPQFGLLKGLYFSVFHSISAFCNAGFDVIGSDSLAQYVGNPIINLTVMSLIVIGGLGFTVWVDLFYVGKRVLNEKMPFKFAIRKLHVHSKIVLISTVGLILIGAICFFIFGLINDEGFSKYNFGTKLWASFFSSVPHVQRVILQ